MCALYGDHINFNFTSKPTESFANITWKKVAFTVDVVQDIRWGATKSTETWNRWFNSLEEYPQDVLIGYTKDNNGPNVDVAILAPLQKLVNGQWITIIPKQR